MDKFTYEFAHLGVNGASKEEALRFLRFCQEILHFKDVRETPVSYFIADEKMELMKEGGEGTKGHIGFFVSPDLMSCLKHLEELGYAVEWEHARKNSDGTIRMVYLRDEFNGFKIHFAQKP